MQFFVSYTGADLAWAEWLAWQLEAAGHRVIIQAWDFRPGENFVVNMRRALDTADHTLAVVSAAYLESVYGTDEWTAAFIHERRDQTNLLVVRVEDVPLPRLLRPWIYIDLVGLAAEEAVARLIDGVQVGRRKPDQAPAFPITIARKKEGPHFPGRAKGLPSASSFANALYYGELEQARKVQLYPFWWDRRHETFWMGDLFGFWTKVPGFDARSVIIEVDRPSIGLSSYRESADGFEYPADTPGRQKVAFAGMSGFFTDGSPRLHVAPVEFGMVRLFETRWADLRIGNPECSVFGITGWQPVPSLLAVHCFVVTQDGWVLLARRSRDRDYCPSAWSVSFEEQIDTGSAVLKEGAGDRTILDTVARGLKEEFDVPSVSIKSTTVVSIGRECFPADSRVVLNAAVICGVIVDLSLDEIWSLLSDTTGAIDRAEHDAWLGIRAIHPHRLDELSTLNRSGREFYMSEAERFGFELNAFPESLSIDEMPLSWHPTSPARLSLCSTLLDRIG